MFWRRRSVEKEIPPSPPQHPVTWDEALTQWDMRCALRQVSSWRTYRSLVVHEQQSLPELMELRIPDLITLGERLRSEAPHRHHGTNTRLTALRRFLCYAASAGLLWSDVTEPVIRRALKGVSIPKPARYDFDTCARQLLQAATKSRYYSSQTTVVMWLLLQGVQARQMTQLQVKHVYWNENPVRLQLPSPSTRALRLPTQVASWLRTLLGDGPIAPGEPLFLDRQHRHALSERSIARIMTQCAKRAGYVGLTLHAVHRMWIEQQVKPYV
jgi:site-specific recombinase XerD